MVHIFFINGVSKTQKLPGGMFFISSCNQIFIGAIIFYKLFLTRTIQTVIIQMLTVHIKVLFLIGLFSLTILFACLVSDLDRLQDICQYERLII